METLRVLLFHRSAFHNAGNNQRAANQSRHLALEPQHDGSALMAASSNAALAYLFKWSLNDCDDHTQGVFHTERLLFTFTSVKVFEKSVSEIIGFGSNGKTTVETKEKKVEKKIGAVPAILGV